MSSVEVVYISLFMVLILLYTIMAVQFHRKFGELNRGRETRAAQILEAQQHLESLLKRVGFVTHPSGHTKTGAP